MELYLHVAPHFCGKAGHLKLISKKHPFHLGIQGARFTLLFLDVKCWGVFFKQMVFIMKLVVHLQYVNGRKQCAE